MDTCACKRKVYTMQLKHLTTLHSIQPYKVSPASGCGKGLWNLLIERSDMHGCILPVQLQRQKLSHLSIDFIVYHSVRSPGEGKNLVCE